MIFLNSLDDISMNWPSIIAYFIFKLKKLTLHYATKTTFNSGLCFEVCFRNSNVKIRASPSLAKTEKFVYWVGITIFLFVSIICIYYFCFSIIGYV